MRKLFLFLLILPGLIVSAQNIQVKLSNKFFVKEKGLIGDNGFCVKEGDGYCSAETDFRGGVRLYGARISNIRYSIDLYRFDQDMRQLQKASVLDDKSDLGPTPPKYLYHHHQLLVFYSKYDTGMLTLFVAAYSPLTLKELWVKTVYSMREDNSSTNNIKEHELKVAVSPDSNSIVIGQLLPKSKFLSCTITNDTTIGKYTISTIESFQDITFNNCFLDNDGNKYFTFSDRYTISWRLLIQNNKGEEKFQGIGIKKDRVTPSKLTFAMTMDKKVLLYGVYGEKFDVGILLTTISPQDMVIRPFQFYEYPEYLVEDMKKVGYVYKGRVSRIDYSFNILDDSTLAFTGYPIQVHNEYSKPYTTGGPIISLFLKDSVRRWSILYKNGEENNSVGLIVIPYKDKIVCIYSDSKENVDALNFIDQITHEEHKRLGLAQTVINSKGKVLSKQFLLEKQSGCDFYIANKRVLNSSSYLIPVGYEGFAVKTRYWVTLTLD